MLKGIMIVTAFVAVTMVTFITVANSNNAISNSSNTAPSWSKVGYAFHK